MSQRNYSSFRGRVLELAITDIRKERNKKTPKQPFKSCFGVMVNFFWLLSLPAHDVASLIRVEFILDPINRQYNLPARRQDLCA